MTAYTIPLTGYPETFSITLNNVNYQMTFLYRDAWFMDIQGVVTGIPLVFGVDMLAPYRYLGFAGSLTLTSTTNDDSPPTYSNLGSTVILTYTPD